jgi:hypothetical protein
LKKMTRHTDMPLQTPANRSPLQSLKSPKYHSTDSAIVAGPSAVQTTVTDADASKREVSEKDTVSQPPASDPKVPTAAAPVMSSLTFDPTWGYYDPDGAHRATFNPPIVRYPDNAQPSRPYSPSQPVPYAVPLHPPARPPAISSRPPPMVRVTYPYYIPPPYPSASYPYSSYKPS